MDIVYPPSVYEGIFADGSFSRLLVRHPYTMRRLRREVAGVMGDSSSPTREQIRKMPFLACVVKECKYEISGVYLVLIMLRTALRLYPPVPLNNREATQTTILSTGGGPDGNSPMLVRKGELVVFS
ncbi:hypothetical protein F4778DRAFT_106462 [Xylariomycetidae sp. FL2044]|nr:hypothetical protein F4778DRAFT_106462 [Xylariomycetidae sp. FL2044]